MPREGGGCRTADESCPSPRAWMFSPPTASSCCDAAAYALVTSTYAAGELRRYWGLAAILSAGTGLGPPHPPITEIAYEFAARLPCLTLAVGAGRPVPALTELLDHVEVAA